MIGRRLDGIVHEFIFKMGWMVTMPMTVEGIGWWGSLQMMCLATQWSLLLVTNCLLMIELESHGLEQMRERGPITRELD